MKHRGFFRAGLLSLITMAIASGEARANDYLIWKSVYQFPSIRMGAGAALMDGKIYFAGGYGMAGASQDANVYTPGSDDILNLNNIPQKREGPTVVSWNHTLLVIGGMDAGGVGQTNTANLNLPDTVWHNYYPNLMNAGRGYMGAAMIGSTVYVFGGFTSLPVTVVDTMESFDYAVGGAGTWNPHNTKHFIEAPKAGMLTVELNGLIYIIGGFLNGPPGASNKMEIYTPPPVGDGFAYGPDLPVAIAFPYGGVIDGKIFVMPSSNPIGGSNPIYVFDPAANKWSTVNYTYDSSFISTTKRASVVVGRKIYLVGGTAPISTIDELSDIDFSVNAPKDGKIQVRNNIINTAKGMTAFIVVRGTAGKSFSLAVYSRAGLHLGDIITDGLIGSDGNTLVVFDGSLKDKKLNSGAYWIVGGGGVKDRQPIMVINEK